ncbi:MAG: hypothetical protein QMC80_07545 [Thermoplasmatales archaeon]|nr:hypothetical protein [Thermoplasmatales archaeon]
MKKIWIDEGHENYSNIEDRGKEGFSKFGDYLRSEGYEVTSTKDCIKAQPADILTIIFPKQVFRTYELQYIENFVKSGGGLLLCGEWGNLYGNADILNSISTAFDIKFNDDKLVSTEDIYKRKITFMGEELGEKSYPQFVKEFSFKEHPVTKELSRTWEYCGCSLNTRPNQVLTWTGKDTFSDKDADAKKSRDESSGRFITSAFAEYKKGRVVCLGDSTKLSNEFIDEGDNKKFVMNIISWLSKSI